jgi:hypothetical protein
VGSGVHAEKQGGAIVGGREKTKIESIKEYQNLLREVFNLN